MTVQSRPPVPPTPPTPMDEIHEPFPASPRASVEDAPPRELHTHTSAEAEQVHHGEVLHEVEEEFRHDYGRVAGWMHAARDRLGRLLPGHHPRH